MGPQEAIQLLEAILDDTLDPDDEDDEKRAEAVELAIAAIRKQQDSWQARMARTT